MKAGDQARKAADRFLVAEGVTGTTSLAPAQLREALDRCAAHLVDRLRLSPADAAELAITVWSEIAGRETNCYFDLQTATAHLVWIVDPIAKTRRAIPVIDLVRMLGPRTVAQVA